VNRVACYVFLFSIFAASLLLSSTLATAGDWPQILGPARNGIAVDEHLAATWPADGPKLLWQREVGTGLAGPAVVGERVILFHRVEDEEVVECLAAADGAPQWRTAFPASYAGGYHADNGPRCVPTVANDRVFLLGAAGDLHCVALTDGKSLWSRALNEDYKVRDGYFGVGSAPLVMGDRVLVNVGGKAGAGIVALAVSDGKTLWTATNDEASYAAPTMLTLDGKARALFVTRMNVVSIAPENGQVLFQFPFGKSGPTVNAATPLVMGNLLFCSASYGVGGVAARFNADGAKEIWRRDDVMSSQYATCIAKDGLLYGVDGREDVGRARLRCFNPLDGNVKWTEEGYGVATLVLAGDKALALKTSGQLVLFQPTPLGYEPLADTQLFETTTQPLPALANGKFFARDMKVLKCLAVGE
jgi:outer membrane protein assembly factor BamB